MNLGINSYSSNYNSMNCKRNNSPSFGMSMLVEKSAEKVIKDQVLSMKPKKAEAFWAKLEELKASSEKNPVNWIIRKCNRRDALAAEVVDSAADTAVKNRVHSQPILFKTGNLKFAEKAKAEADLINDTNLRIADLPKAKEADFYAGGIMPESVKPESVKPE